MTLAQFINENLTKLGLAKGQKFRRCTDGRICRIKRAERRTINGKNYYRVFYNQIDRPELELWCDHNSPNGCQNIMLEERNIKSSRQWKRRG